MSKELTTEEAVRFYQERIKIVINILKHFNSLHADRNYDEKIVIKKSKSWSKSKSGSWSKSWN